MGPIWAQIGPPKGTPNWALLGPKSWPSRWAQMLFSDNTILCISEIYTQSIFRKLFNQLRPELIHDFPETQNGGAVILDHLDCQKHGLDEEIQFGQGFWAQMLFSDKTQYPKNCIFRLDFHFYMSILFFAVHTVKDLAELV